MRVRALTFLANLLDRCDSSVCGRTRLGKIRSLSGFGKATDFDNVKVKCALFSKLGTMIFGASIQMSVWVPTF